MVKTMKKKVAKKAKAAPKAASTKAVSTKAASTKAASTRLNALDRLMMNMPHKTVLKKYGAAAGLGAAGVAGIVGLQKLQKKNPELFNRIFKVAMEKGPEPAWLTKFLGGIFYAKKQE